MAKSMLEWMSDAIMKKFDNNRENQFNLKFVTMCHNLAELEKIPGPRVILASSLDLMAGIGLDLLMKYSSDPKCLIVIPDRGMPNTLLRKLATDPKTTELSFEVCVLVFARVTVGRPDGLDWIFACSDV